jgi:hypothetical protein
LGVRGAVAKVKINGYEATTTMSTYPHVNILERSQRKKSSLHDALADLGVLFLGTPAERALGIKVVDEETETTHEPQTGAAVG